MTLSQFRCQPLQERPQLVRVQGTLLIVQTRGTYCVFLYHMGSFFAEVWYSLTQRSVEMVQGFHDSRMLEPYLELIGIAELE